MNDLVFILQSGFGLILHYSVLLVQKDVTNWLHVTQMC